MAGLIAILVVFFVVVPIALIVTIVRTRNELARLSSDIRLEFTDLRKQLGELLSAIRASGLNPDSAEEASTVVGAVSERKEPPAVPVAEQHAGVGAVPPAVPGPATSVSCAADVSVAETRIPDTTEAVTSAPIPAAERRPPPRIVQDAGAVLRRIWSWVLVGEEYRPKNLPIEFAVASTWLMRLGIVLLVFAVGYFLRLLHSWMGPWGRVALAITAGVTMVAAGMRIVRGAYRILGHGLVGGGLAALYFSMYAAGPLYGLLPLGGVFALMALVTVAAGVLSVSLDSQITAVLGIVGGFATPVMLRTQEPNFIVLYAYMLLLGAAILAISHAKQWRMLNYLGFLCTWALFFGSLGGYDREQHFVIALPFLSALFLLHSAIVYYYNVVRRLPATVLETLHLLANVALYAGAAYGLIEQACGRPWPALMSAGVAALYVAHVYFFLRRQMQDRRLLVAFLGIAAFFTIWTVPLVFEKETLTIFWALEALLLMWLGRKSGSSVLGLFSCIMYVIVLWRVVAWDMPRSFSSLDWSSEPWSAYLHAFWDRLWTFGTVVASLFLGFRVQARSVSPFPNVRVAPAADITVRAGGWARVARDAAYWCGVGVLFLAVYLECSCLFSYVRGLQAPVLTLLWAGLALFLLAEHRRTGSAVLFTVGSAATAIVVGKLLFYDCALWDFEFGRLGYHAEPAGFAVRLLDYGFAVALLVLGVRYAAGFRGTDVYRRAYKVAAIVVTFVYATLETSTFFHHYMSGFKAGALSVLWALFAVGFVVRGLQRGSRAYRYSGLVLFGVVTLKVFLIDLAGMPTAYRVVGSLAVGGLLLAGSFVYLRAARRAPDTGKGVC